MYFLYYYTKKQIAGPIGLKISNSLQARDQIFRFVFELLSERSPDAAITPGGPSTSEVGLTIQTAIEPEKALVDFSPERMACYCAPAEPDYGPYNGSRWCQRWEKARDGRAGKHADFRSTPAGSEDGAESATQDCSGLSSGRLQVAIHRSTFRAADGSVGEVWGFSAFIGEEVDHFATRLRRRLALSSRSMRPS